jgi:site-specific DNA recombinase
MGQILSLRGDTVDKESSNGHQAKRVVLYARISTDEQARSGYSLAQQLEALREHAAREGYEVLEEVVDPGHSGASLARPGMDRVRDLVAVGDVSIVLAQDRDRFAREPAYHYLLKRELEERGCKLQALNDRGDESPEGELTDGILDQLAKYERAKIAERTRRGTLRKAREGHTVTIKPNYGFRVNAAKNGLEVYEPEMLFVKRIFRMAAEGLGAAAIQAKLHAEGVPAPKGGKVWYRQTIRKLLDSDVYRPYSFAEIEDLVSPEALARLDPAKEYGVQWYNRQKVTKTSVSEPDGRGGRRYKNVRTFVWKPREEWVAVPVPAHLPSDLVDRARTMITVNKGSERKHLAREWELRGLMRCSCGATMVTHTTKPHGRYLYHYYSCHKRRELRQMGLCRQPSLRASKVEPVVWDFISGLLKDPERIRAGMEALIEQEQAVSPRDADEQAAVWAKKLAECDQLRGAYQDQQAAGFMTLEELGSKLEGLEETRRTVRAELAALEAGKERVSELKRDRDALLESWTGTVPEALESLPGEERNKVYRMLRLEVTPTLEGCRVTGALSGFLYSGTDAWREATVKKLKGARLHTPSRLTLEVQAIGWGTTDPISSL